MPSGRWGILTLSHGGDLILDRQHEFGFSGQVLAAALFVLQGYSDAPRQVVHAADHRRVSVCLKKGKRGNFLHVQTEPLYLFRLTDERILMS